MQGAADSSHGAEPGSSGPWVDRRFALLASAALALVCIVLWLIGWQLRGWISAWPRFADDAYYYLVVASNAASGHGFTMDRLSPTNGFQPLWMFALLPIAALFGHDHNLLLLVVQATSVAIFCVAGGILCGLVRARFGLAPALTAGLLLLFPRILNVATSGMESALVILVTVALLIEALRSGALTDLEPRASDARTGLLVGLLMLARLDSVFVGLTLAAWVGVQGLTRGDGGFGKRLARTVRKGLTVFWPSLALLVPYLCWNVISFGRLNPISGTVKSGFPVPSFHPLHLNLEQLGLFAFLFGAVAFEFWRGRRREPLVRLLGVLSIGLTLHALNAVIFMRWAVFSWHFAVLVPTGLLGAALLVRAAAQRLPQRLVLAGVAGLALLQLASLSLSLSRLSYTFTVASREGGEWVAANLPPDAVLGMKDSGIFSYFSRRRVMNLDGVANSFEFAEAVCRGELEKFVRERGVQYISQHSVPQDVRLGDYETFAQKYPCGLRDGEDEVLVFHRELEIYRGTPYKNNAGRTEQLVIWKLAPG